MVLKEDIAAEFKKIQDEITKALELLDGKGQFVEESWERDGGGGGRTRILQNGRVLEKAGVNFSAVHGTLPESIKNAFGVDEDMFFATGISIVIHPNNPHVPIIHMNIRYFELNENLRWFGGGVDLTPHYIVADDAQFFHREVKQVCDKYHPKFYADFKKWADDYFFIKHRQETRGIGGIFYDKLTPEKTGLTWDHLFAFSCELGRNFAPIYSTLVNRRRDQSYSVKEKEFQLLRRGRYVEFNLVYDSGTKFGLETNGRIESILMSLPGQANWFYDYKPESGSAEQQTLDLLKKNINWAI